MCLTLSGTKEKDTPKERSSLPREGAKRPRHAVRPARDPVRFANKATRPALMVVGCGRRSKQPRSARTHAAQARSRRHLLRFRRGTQWRSRSHPSYARIAKPSAFRCGQGGGERRLGRPSRESRDSGRCRLKARAELRGGLGRCLIHVSLRGVAVGPQGVEGGVDPGGDLVAVGLGAGNECGALEEEQQ